MTAAAWAVLSASPWSLCAGVQRAIETVEQTVATAHGVSSLMRAVIDVRSITVIDATCPLVTGCMAAP